jgi:alkaline phosphatase D
VDNILSANPHIRYGNGSDRGYVLVDIREDKLEAKLRGVASVKVQDSPISTVASFEVASGAPGVRRA